MARVSDFPPGYRFTPSGLRGPAQFTVPPLPQGYHFTKSGLRGGPVVTMEDLVRPFLPIDSFSTPRQLPVSLIVEPEAFVEWGQVSAFSFEGGFRELASGGGGMRVDDDGDDEPPTLTYTEVGRRTSNVRVENPDDPDIFVDVERVDSFTLRAPNGGLVQFHFRN